MDILKEADFRKEIKGTPRTGYLFFGEEANFKLGIYEPRVLSNQS